MSREFIVDLDVVNPRAELSKALLVLGVVGVELPEVRDLPAYAPSLDVDIKAHLASFKPSAKPRRL